MTEEAQAVVIGISIAVATLIAVALALGFIASRDPNDEGEPVTTALEAARRVARWIGLAGKDER